MEFIIGAFVEPGSVEDINVDVLNGILNEFFVAGNTIQVGMMDPNPPNYVGFSEYTETNDISTILPFSEVGSKFIGIAVRETTNAPDSNWYFSWHIKAPNFFSGDEPYLAYPCDLTVKQYPEITTVQVQEVILGMKYLYDPTIIPAEPPASLPLYPAWYFGRKIHDMPNILQFNTDSFGASAVENPLYFRKISDVYYYCSENFTASTLLEDAPGTGIGGHYFPR